MKVFVVYEDWVWENCSCPIVAFSTEKLAKKFCENKNSKYPILDWHHYKELEVDKEPDGA